MTTEYFSYDKPKVIQALRYHFISRPEIKLMMVIINVFAIISAALFFFKKIHAEAFLISSLLWFILMIIFWFILPTMVYKRAHTFKDSFKANFNDQYFSIENKTGSRSWEWKEFSSYIESPHFFHLYFNARSFFIIPKDAFLDGEDHEARKIIAKNIKK